MQKRRLVRIDPQILNPRDYVIVDGQAIRRISGGMPVDSSFMKNEPSMGPVVAQVGVAAATLTAAEKAAGVDLLIPLYEQIPVQLVATTASQAVFIGDTFGGAQFVVVGVQAVAEVLGGAGATINVEVLTGVQAPGAGVAQLTAALVLNGVAHQVQQGTLIANPTVVTAGNRIGIVMAGTLTGLVGNITILIKRVA